MSVRIQISNELWTLSELLESEGQAMAAREAWEASQDVRSGRISANTAIRKLVNFENMIGF